MGDQETPQTPLGDGLAELSEELRAALRKDMSGRIEAFQCVIDEDTVYCEQCEVEVDFTPSVLLVHNIRRHREEMDDE